VKKLKIFSSGCEMTTAKDYIAINGTSLEQLVRKNLPEGLEDYKNYPIKIDLSIDFIADDPIEIHTENY